MVLNANNMNNLREAVDNREAIPESFKELFEEVDQVDAESTVFNFECCSPCTKEGFGGDLNAGVIAAVARLLHHGFFVMFSDFSLMALLKAWDDDLLGKRPFQQVGSYGSSCELRFSPNVLKECASAQLVTVGQLCESGEAYVHAMSGTIAYAPLKGLDLSNEPYTMELLTVITKADQCQPTITEPNCTEAQIGDHKGYAGHSMLSYKNGGGHLLLSSCHWVELSSLSTSEENVFQAFAANQGNNYRDARFKEYQAAPESARGAMLQSFARGQVQSSAPCRYKK